MKDVIWLKERYYQKHESPKMSCEPGNQVGNKMLEAGRKKKSVASKEISPDLCDTSRCMVRIRYGQTSLPPVCLIDEKVQ